MSDPNIQRRYREAVEELHPPAVHRATTPRLIVENDRLRGKLWFWRCIAALLAGALIASFAFGEDCLNRDLSTAVGDALVIAKHQGGHARVRYLTLYAVPEEKRLETIAGISALCHQLSHAGVAIQPHKIAPTVWRLDLNLFDPHNVGWERGWEEIVQHDRRWHYGDLAPADANTSGKVFVGSLVEVKCTDGKFYPARVVELASDGYFFEISGRRFHSRRNTMREPKAVVTHATAMVRGDWVDYSAAKLLEEITGSQGAILDGREFAFYAARTPVYYTFRATPPTLAEWLRGWGEYESRGFGAHGVRGANLDSSNVTFTSRGIERRRLPVYLTFDQSKANDLTEERDPFSLPDRRHKFDATEAFALTANGGLDCAIFDGSGQRVDAVPPAVAIDTSYGTRELLPGLSCWSCHTKGAENPSGFIAFADEQSQRRSFVKDPKLAADLASYYGNGDQLAEDMARDRAAFTRGCGQAAGLLPSRCFAIVNAIAADIETGHVDAVRACRELCIDDEGDAAGALTKWLNGTINPTLVTLMDNGRVHYQRFRLALPEALHAVHQRRIFAK